MLSIHAGLAFFILLAPVPKDPKSALSGVLDKADQLFEAKDYRAAWVLYRKALFAAPGHPRAVKREQETNRQLVDALVARGDALWESDPRGALACYRGAEKVNPQGVSLKAAFTKRGYKFHQGMWRKKDSLDAFEAQDRERGKSRLASLRLAGAFKPIRLGVFRFLTDVDESSPQLKHMMEAIQTHYQEYVRLMQPLGLVHPEQGLDVVLFRKKDDYVRHTKSNDTLGLYVPRLGVSYYYLTGAGEDFATLLHEMTHQLNHKVSRMAGLPAPIEEGIAEFFGYGSLTNGARKLVLGTPRGEYIQDIKAALNGRPRGLIPFDSFFRSVTADEDDLFYPQSWALVHYLMQAHPSGRLILFDLFQGAKTGEVAQAEAGEAGATGSESDENGEGDESDDDERPSSRPAGGGTAPGRKPSGTLEGALTACGLTVEALEKQFREYYRNLR